MLFVHVFLASSYVQTFQIMYFMNYIMKLLCLFYVIMCIIFIMYVMFSVQCAHYFMYYVLIMHTIT
jgi:hypothetical protein